MKPNKEAYRTFFKENGQKYTFLDLEIHNQNSPSPLSYQKFKQPDQYAGFKIKEKYDLPAQALQCKRDYYPIDRSPGRTLPILKLNTQERFIKHKGYKLVKKGWDYLVEFTE